MSYIFNHAAVLHRENIKVKICQIIDKIIAERSNLYYECGNPAAFTPSQILQDVISDIEESFISAMKMKENALEQDALIQM